ncbi:hypothetical protein ACQ3VH_15940 [Bacillus pretiosus]|uniref:hypothetical protein n=1 Tax=Bacillus pretiosus TaxID=2983392 RepID=UPI002ED9164B
MAWRVASFRVMGEWFGHVVLIVHQRVKEVLQRLRKSFETQKETNSNHKSKRKEVRNLIRIAITIET